MFLTVMQFSGTSSLWIRYNFGMFSKRFTVDIICRSLNLQDVMSNSDLESRRLMLLETKVAHLKQQTVVSTAQAHWGQRKFRTFINDSRRLYPRPAMGYSP
jgi:hypothetical protein